MKIRMSGLRSFACGVVLASSPLALFYLTIRPIAAFAQRGPLQRIVRGKVTDMLNTPIAGAVVQLKDTKSLKMKSFITDNNGAYQFMGLMPDTDYEIRVDYEGKKGDVKTISSFDSRKELHIDLKINK